MPAGRGSEIKSGLKDAVRRGADELGLQDVNFVKEALRWQYNWIGLAGAAAFAIVSGTGLPLVLAAGLELIYLSLVPQSSAFRRLVRSWKYAEEKKRREMTLAAMLNELPKDLRARYQNLCAICRGIRENYSRLSSTTQIFFGQMDEKLSGLLAAHLRMLHSEHQHEEYLKATNPGEIARDLEQLKKALEGEPPKVQEINRRRIEILSKRLEKYEKVKENRKVVRAQCSAIEDVLELIRDQSVTLRDPQQLSDQLENLVRDVEQTEQTVREVEAIFELASPEMTGAPAGWDPLASAEPPSGASQPAPRARTRT
jgi:hypothetical protein